MPKIKLGDLKENKIICMFTYLLTNLTATFLLLDDKTLKSFTACNKGKGSVVEESKTVYS